MCFINVYNSNTMELGEKITIDQLAGMMNKSFAHLEKRMDSIEEKVGTGFKELKGDIKEVKADIAEIDDRLGIIEGKFINNHENRISKTEDDMRLVKTRLQIG